MKIAAFVLICAVLMLCACSYQQATTPKNIGYVHIQGNTSGVEVYVNGVAKTVKFDKNTHTAMLELKPGQYQITIRRNGMDIINENVSVTTSGTSEVIVP